MQFRVQYVCSKLHTIAKNCRKLTFNVMFLTIKQVKKKDLDKKKALSLGLFSICGAADGI